MTASDCYIAPAVIREEWEKALSLSGVDPAVVAPVICDGERYVGEPPAQWLSPEMNADSYAFYRDFKQFDRWTGGENVKLHRITIAAHIPCSPLAQPMTGAILAHELHHVYEWENGGKLGLRLRPAVELVLAQRHGAALRGAHVNQAPYEVDCDAAAARFLRAHHPAAISAILASDDPSPARASERPPDPKTLQRRTLEFLFEQAVTIEQPLRLPPGKTSIEEWLDALAPSSMTIWHELQRERQ